MHVLAALLGLQTSKNVGRPNNYLAFTCLCNIGNRKMPGILVYFTGSTRWIFDRQDPHSDIHISGVRLPLLQTGVLLFVPLIAANKLIEFYEEYTVLPKNLLAFHKVYHFRGGGY